MHHPPVPSLQRPVATSLRPTRPSRAISARLSQAAGFSLMEGMVALTIFAFALAMAGVMNGVSTRGLQRSTILNDRNAAVDADIAAIRSMADRYTWCSGAPDLKSSNTHPCQATSPSDESYYSPAVTQEEALIDDENGNASMLQFTIACANFTLNDNLVERINSRPAVSGLTRKAQVMKLGNANTNRIEILYATPEGDPNPLVRSVVVTPPVTAFCP